MSDKGASAKDTHCGFTAVIGAPNAGKSTLVNALVGAKVSIVTHKAQTTRARMRGIAIAGKSQIVLVDTPGIFRPKRRLDRAMVETAWTEAREADVAVLVLDAIRGLDDVAEPIFQQAGQLKIPLVLALNKVDKVDKAKLLALASEASKSLPLEQLFMELILFRAIPRRDVKPLAKEILARFGSFAEAVAAPRERLMEIEGVTEAVVTEIKVIQAAALRTSQSEVRKRYLSCKT